MFYIVTERHRCSTCAFVSPTFTLSVIICFLIPKVYAGQNWPSFRGPSAAGVMEGYPTPMKWDLERSQNIHWKVPIPGLGHSCPTVWGDRVFVTSAVKDEGQSSLKVCLYGNVESAKEENIFSWHLCCIDRETE